MASLQHDWSQSRSELTEIIGVRPSQLSLNQSNWRERLIILLAFATIFSAGAIMHGKFTSLRSPGSQAAAFYAQTAPMRHAK